MEIDCLICGQIGMCTFVSSPATIQDNNDGSNNQENSKWSKCFCELLGVNTELVPETEGILESSYYCNHCIPDLQFIYETFCEIEALRESLNSKKDGCKVKLRNASLKCNADDRGHIDQSNQFENVTTTNDGKDFDFKALVELDFHPSPNNSPSQALSRDKLLKCLKKDLADPSPRKLDHESGNKGKDQDQQPWTSPSNTFEDEYYSQLENVSVLTPETIEFESESDQEGMLGKSCQGKTVTGMKTGISKTMKMKRIPKPKRLQIKADKLTETDIISDDEEEPSQSNRLPSRLTKIQDYSKLGSNSDSDDDPGKNSSDSRASSEEYNSDCDDSDYSVRKGLSKNKRRRKRKSDRKEFFLPTVLSDQDTIKNIELLEEEYDELIKYYGIKKLRIPVMKLPDDDSGSESENMKINCKCPITDCKTRFLRKFKLIEHIRVVHRGIKYNYECKICNKTFRRTYDYREHLNIHSNSLPYSCPDCDYKFPTQKRLQDHKRLRHSLTKFQCDQCGKFFPTHHIYQAHLRRHSSDRPFVCEVCGKSYKFPHDLRYHRTLHPELNLKQFKCEVCGKVFSHAQGLKQHMRGHTGNLPFLCDKCDFRAASAGLLKSHMNRHTEGKPYECEACHSKYKTRSGLSMHQRFDCGTDKDSKNFVCEECGKGFCTIIRLKTHKKIHKIVGKPFLCYICGSSYTKKQNLERHHTTCHKDVETESSCKDVTDDVSGPLSLLPETPSVEDRSEGQPEFSVPS